MSLTVGPYTYCSYCGTQLPDEAHYCWKCGRPSRAAETAKSVVVEEVGTAKGNETTDDSESAPHRRRLVPFIRFRWVFIIAVAVLVGAGGLYGLVISKDNIDGVTRESLKGAVLEYGRLEEQATYRLDASILEPRASTSWLEERSALYAKAKAAGLVLESKLVSAQFKAFRRLGDGSVEVDVVEVWNSKITARNGTVILNSVGRITPQTVRLIQVDNRWKLNEVRFYPDDIPL